MRMQTINLQEKMLKSALLQFIFPFSIKSGRQTLLKEILLREQFVLFDLSDLEMEDAFYGEGYQVSHQYLERYYLSFASHILFPRTQDPEAFQRYSKSLSMPCRMKTATNQYKFIVLSVDVTVCPFNIGFITIRTQLEGESISLTNALEFACRFRALQDVTPLDSAVTIFCEDQEYEEVEKFIFRELASSVLSCLDRDEIEGAYFETLPYFVDERMFVQGCYVITEGQEIATEDLYRVCRLDGVDELGNAYITSTNIEYINQYCNNHSYKRWAPNSYFMTNEHTFSCVTNANKQISTSLSNQMYGEYYYGLLLNLFHKIVLLKLSNQYSEVQMARDREEMEELTHSITKFSSKYFFSEWVSQSQGREIFDQMRKHFVNNELFIDVKNTLADLYKYQERYANKKQNNLLMVLTLYSVMGGILGMNLVVEDFKYKMTWSKISAYSILEYAALFVTISGLIVALVLGVKIISRWMHDRKKKKN